MMRQHDSSRRECGVDTPWLFHGCPTWRHELILFFMLTVGVGSIWPLLYLLVILEVLSMGYVTYVIAIFYGCVLSSRMMFDRAVVKTREKAESTI